jgi:hypothetical protein
MSLVFLMTLGVSLFGDVPNDVLSALAFGVSAVWTAQAGTQGFADAQLARATPATKPATTPPPIPTQNQR